MTAKGVATKRAKAQQVEPVNTEPEVQVDIDVVDGVILEDDEERIVHDAVAILRSANGAGPQFKEQVRAEVLRLFARVEVSPRMPSMVAGIGNLFENGYDEAAVHMEMAHWGLPHRLRPAAIALPSSESAAPTT
ncbi:MAG TPA: hypothetical protein VFZ63_18705 [Jiangellaceae bacterium]